MSEYLQVADFVLGKYYVSAMKCADFMLGKYYERVGDPNEVLDTISDLRTIGHDTRLQSDQTDSLMNLNRVLDGRCMRARATGGSNILHSAIIWGQPEWIRMLARKGAHFTSLTALFVTLFRNKTDHRKSALTRRARPPGAPWEAPGGPRN